MKILTGSTFAVLFLSGSLAHAAIFDESKSPLGCRDQGYQFKLNILTMEPEAAGDRQSLYFLFNRLNRPVSLYQMLGEESVRSMPFNHVINAQQWSILSTSQKQMKYICTVEDGSKHGKIVNCSDSVKVCEFVRVKYGLNNRGNYWFSGSASRGEAVADALHYGIIPR
jgi:hypothetical protein